MKIKTLKLKHYRRFSDFQMEFDEQLTVLVAKNGAGKTSVLDAVVTLLGAFLTRLPKVSGLNPKETDFQVYPDGRSPPYMYIGCESINGVSWDRTEKRDQSKTTNKEISDAQLDAKGVRQLNDYVDTLIDAENEGLPYQLPVFIYYGTGRGVFEIPQRKRGFSKEFRRFDAFVGSLASHTNFRSFVEYFYFLEEQENRVQKEKRSFEYELPELKAIRTAISRMMPEFSNPRPIYPAGIVVDWEQDATKKQLRIEQLSDGYRTTLAMVMDIAARMAEANPEMEDPLQTEGIVLIDEVDLHLHPGWQQTILLDLMRTFSNIQFIVSTHSPQVISSVKPKSLRVIDWIDNEPCLVPVNFSEGAESQQVLLDVLGLKSSRVEKLGIVQDLHRYQELVHQNKWDSDEAQELRSKLDTWGSEHEPELTRLDMDIRLQELDR